MKILMVGSAKPFAIEASYKKHLKKWAEVSLFEAHDLFLAHYTKSTLHKLVYRSGFSSILQRINKKLVAIVSANRPDIVWVFKGMEIYPETLKKIKTLGAVMVNYNADDPFDYTFAGSGNQNVKKSLSLYDHHFSYSHRIVDRFRNELQIESSWLPFAYNTALQPKEYVENPTIVCFIGNPDKQRSSILHFLAKSGIQIHVYGNNWNKFVRHANIVIKGSVMNEELILTAQKYYCQLNVFRPQNVNSHNMRTFEMPALGCVMFAPKSKEHSLFFEDQREAYYYENEEELKDKIQQFLSLTDQEKNKIARNAFDRSLAEQYSYEYRAKTVFAVFYEMMRSRSIE
jgi:spore maturation protein CgeB